MTRFYDKLARAAFGKELSGGSGIVFSRGIRSSFVVMMVSTVLTFGSGWLMVNCASVPEYGIYVHVFNWVSVLMIFACFGMEDLVLAEIPALVEKKQNDEVCRLVWKVNWFLLFFSALIATLWLGVVFSGMIPGLRGHWAYFLLAAVNIYLMAFIVVNQQVLQALDRILASQFADKVLKSLLVVAVLAAFYFARTTVNARVLILLGTAAVAIAALVVAIFIVKAIPAILSRVERPAFLETRLMGKAKYFLAISLVVMLKSKLTMLLLGSFATSASVGIFNVTSRLADLVLFPYIIIHSVVPQLFARYEGRGKRDVAKLYFRINRVIGIASFILLLVLVFLGRTLLNLFDPTLPPYYVVLVILCAAQFSYSFFGPATALLMMQGKQRQVTQAVIIDLLFNLVAFFVLLKMFDIVGAAWATFLGSLTYNLVLRWLLNKHLSPGAEGLSVK